MAHSHAWFQWNSILEAPCVLPSRSPSPAFFCFQPIGVQSHEALPLGPLYVWTPNQMGSFDPLNRTSWKGESSGCHSWQHWLLCMPPELTQPGLTPLVLVRLSLSPWVLTHLAPNDSPCPCVIWQRRRLVGLGSVGACIPPSRRLPCKPVLTIPAGSFFLSLSLFSPSRNTVSTWQERERVLPRSQHNLVLLHGFSF